MTSRVDVLLASEDSEAAVSDEKAMYEDAVCKASESLASEASRLQSDVDDKRREVERIEKVQSEEQSEYLISRTRTLQQLGKLHDSIITNDTAAVTEREKRQEDVTGMNREILSAERGFHADEKTLLTGRSDLVGKLLDLEHELAESKAAHIEKVHTMEAEAHAVLLNEKEGLENDVTLLKSRGQDDLLSLKTTHRKTLSEIKHELCQVDLNISQMEEKAGPLLNGKSSNDNDICKTQ